MTTTEVAVPQNGQPPTPTMPNAGVVARTADMITQATAVEQARAVAEVQAAIVVAQQCPRDVTTAISQMREACQQKALADRAFFRFPRAGSTVSGPSIHLARELARCWGNIQYDIKELRRDDDAGVSEMQAFAWDVQTNTRAANTFVVPHKRDVRGKDPQPLVDLRDIYENNANLGARRLREAIFAVLPVWFREEAMQICTKTIEDGGGKPLAQRVADAVQAFGNRGVNVTRLEQRVGSTRDKWTAHDIAQLSVIFESVNRGEVRIDEEFPEERVTGAEIKDRPAPPPPATPDAAAEKCPGRCGAAAGAHEPLQCPGPDGEQEQLG